MSGSSPKKAAEDVEKVAENARTTAYDHLFKTACEALQAVNDDPTFNGQMDELTLPTQAIENAVREVAEHVKDAIKKASSSS